MDKECFKCGEKKPISHFYRNAGMKDGHLNKCKECTIKDSALYRNKNIEKVRKYDRERGNRQDASYLKEWRAKHPKKYKAHVMLNNHKRAGNIYEEPCEVCGCKKVVGHHDDYDKPLNVRWLCQTHHKQWHSENGEGKNSK